MSILQLTKILQTKEKWLFQHILLLLDTATHWMCEHINHAFEIETNTYRDLTGLIVYQRDQNYKNIHICILQICTSVKSYRSSNY